MQGTVDVIQIPLTMGKFATIDADDYALVGGLKWHCLRARLNFYAVRKVHGADGKWHTLRMHTAITGFAVVDHINGDGLDNRRVNLREATVEQNNRNLRKTPGRTSEYKGVTWYKQTGCWNAQIGVKGKSISLGYYPDEMAAAMAYDQAARRHFGEFAALNFPGPGENSAHLSLRRKLGGPALDADTRAKIRQHALREASAIVDAAAKASDGAFETEAEAREYERQLQLIAIRLYRQSGRDERGQ